MMLGYTNAEKAQSMGFSHHASFYGIPIWIGELHTDQPIVMVKWSPMNLLMDLFELIEIISFGLVPRHDQEEDFMFTVGEPIEADSL